MGPFELQVELALLERRSDLAFVSEGTRSHKMLLRHFQRIEEDGEFHSHFADYRTGYSLDMRNFPDVRLYFPGAILFLPAHVIDKLSRRGGGLGFTKDGRPVIVLHHFKHGPGVFKDWFPENFVLWWKYGLLHSWRHELAHFLDSKRNPTIKAGTHSSAKKFDTGNTKGYVNSASELQAWYIEYVSVFYDYVDQIEDMAFDPDVPEWRRVATALPDFKDFRTFLSSFKQKAPGWWWEALTRDNQKRIIKRAATTYDELVKRLNDVLPRDWRRWSSSRLVQAAKAEKARAA